MSNNPPLRKRDELLDLLEQRRRAYLKLPFEYQKEIDKTRIVPTLELHDLLEYYLTHGRCPDEPLFMGESND